MMLKKSLAIPFELVLNHLIIEAKINGENNFKLTLDTGMPISGIILFKNKKSENLNLSYSGQTYVGGAGGNPILADVASGVNVEIGDLQLANRQIIVMSMNRDVLTSLESDGIIGYELFIRYLLQIDFEKNLINLWNDSSEVVAEPGQELNLELKQNYPFTHCLSEIVKGKEFPLDLVIDLGAGHALSLDLKSNNNFVLPENALESRIGTGAIGDIFGHIGRVSKFLMGNYHFDDMVTTFSNGPLARGFLKCNGNLGIEILRRFFVTFDYKNSKIYLKPNVYFDDPFIFNMTGFQFHKMDDGNFIVDFIINNSPAKEVGLMQNDIIIEINDKSAKLVNADTLDKMSKKDSTKLNLVVLRNSELLNFTLRLRMIL